MSRFYTTARRHPWVLGKVADWKIPLGPYTPAQIALAVAGGFLLIKTISWWSWLGPVPIVAWILAIWTVRRPKIRGRAPLQAALGWVLLGWQPKGGRIGGRAARDRAPRPLLGGFTIEDVLRPAATAPAAPSWGARHASAQAAHPAPLPTAARSYGRRRRPLTAPPAHPVSGVQQLLARAQQNGGQR
ncbi:hypothetical protein ACIBL8_43040 [Streptomyces sp. NPDC050523]|uniref:hypothetical protein n=1 Tax=Streptomyces sp. NPDC050523 TaxID=3365622 RepID=UPI0037B2403F